MGNKSHSSYLISHSSPIGVFDSGIGGLTVLKEIIKELPQYDYVYLGDNARAPYGSRSFDTVYRYTRECVQKLFGMNCRLVILACNTASAKALKNIQQLDLPGLSPKRNVLGIIIPTSEVIGDYTKTRHVGILGTAGTVQSNSYKIEINKNFPDIKVFQQACPMWVPLVENGEVDSPATDILIKQYLDELFKQSKRIDAIILGCTHYPVLLNKIKKQVPEKVKILSQGSIVAKSLADYLMRHSEYKNNLTKGKTVKFYTTDSPAGFDKLAGTFFGKKVKSEHIEI